MNKLPISEYEMEELLLEKDFEVNDEVFNNLQVGTLKILKLFLLKGYILNENSYKIIMSDVFCDDEYYSTIDYLYNHNYVLPNKIMEDVKLLLSQKNIN